MDLQRKVRWYFFNSKYLSERFHSDESHRSDIIGCHP